MRSCSVASHAALRWDQEERKPDPHGGPLGRDQAHATAHYAFAYLNKFAVADPYLSLLSGYLWHISVSQLSPEATAEVSRAFGRRLLKCDDIRWVQGGFVSLYCGFRTSGNHPEVASCFRDMASTVPLAERVRLSRNEAAAMAAAVDMRAEACLEGLLEALVSYTCEVAAVEYNDAKAADERRAELMQASANARRLEDEQLNRDLEEAKRVRLERAGSARALR